MIQRSQHNCVQVCSSQHNAHPVHMPSNMHVPCLQVMAFSNRKEADDFLQSRQKYVLGAVHFVDSPSKQLQYIIQSNTSVSIWENIQAPTSVVMLPARKQRQALCSSSPWLPVAAVLQVLCAVCATLHAWEHSSPADQRLHTFHALQTPYFKGYVQSPNDFFQMPFMSAIAREISRHYLEAAGRSSEAAALTWQPQLAAFPHPQLSPGNAGYILPPFIFVACMFATISFLGVVVSEKESGLRQALQTMGLQQGSYWLSWWLFEALMAAITAWAIIAFGKPAAAALLRNMLFAMLQQ